MSAKKILFIIPASSISVFNRSKISVAVPNIPIISVAQLAACVRLDGHTPAVLDLSIIEKKKLINILKKKIDGFCPDYIGITFTTPLFKESTFIAKVIKKFYPTIKIIAGGPHASVDPEGVLKSSLFNTVVMGEGEMTLNDILNGVLPSKIKGIGYLTEDSYIINEPRELIGDLDELPLPDYSIFDIYQYSTPRLNCRRNPVAAIETSRGCIFNCIFCSKHVFRRKFRAKSPKRVADEMQHLYKQGFNEVHIWDDGFSTDLKRAKNICKELIRRNIKIPWNIYNGIRVDRCDFELFSLLKRAGCYRISFGVESGSQKILDTVHKSIKLDQIILAFKKAHNAGLETVAFCVFGFPGETEATMKETIRFMKKIKPTIPKLSFFMPLPGTKVYDDWEKEGFIISHDWSNYIYHMPKKVYNHPTLKWEILNKYYNLFYRQTMLYPEFILNWIKRGIKNGEILFYLYYFLKTLRWGW